MIYWKIVIKVIKTIALAGTIFFVVFVTLCGESDDECEKLAKQIKIPYKLIEVFSIICFCIYIAISFIEFFLLDN